MDLLQDLASSATAAGHLAREKTQRSEISVPIAALLT